tara:strand:- start:2025 stop:2264 length:240 start_codon:yes stop_codon:yes gene_type:complete
MKFLRFSRGSYRGQILQGDTLDRLLLLGDLCDQAYGGHTGQWVRLIFRMYRHKIIPEHIAECLDDIEEGAITALNLKHR